MSVTIPTTQDLVARNKAQFESKLNQTVPATDKAFVNVLSVVLGLIETELERKIINDAKQNLALTATREGLDELGSDYGIIRGVAEACVITGTVTAETGKTISATASFIADRNGIRYFPDSSFAEAGGLITATLTSTETGISANLEIGDTLSIESQLAGVGTVLTVNVVDNLGVEKEDDEDYRQRILSFQRTLKGGGNSADYRRWAIEVTGVVNAFPYSKLPYDDASYPGNPPERTVYVEADTTVDPDGIPPTALLDDVRDSITTDPITGLDRQPLGLTDATLYVEPIRRTSFDVEIDTLAVDASVLVSTQENIETSLTAYFLSLAPFVVGLDFEGEKNEVITDLTISELVQNAISGVGGNAQGIRFKETGGSFITIYTLGEGEMAKLGTITYV